MNLHHLRALVMANNKIEQVNTHKYTHTLSPHIHTQSQKHIHTHTQTHTCLTSNHTQIHMHTHTLACSHTQTYICTQTAIVMADNKIEQVNTHKYTHAPHIYMHNHTNTHLLNK